MTRPSSTWWRVGFDPAYGARAGAAGLENLVVVLLAACAPGAWHAVAEAARCAGRRRAADGAPDPVERRALSNIAWMRSHASVAAVST